MKYLMAIGVVAAVVLTAGAGCENKTSNGDGAGEKPQTEEQQASDAALAYFQGIGEQDAKKACDALTTAAQAELEKAVPAAAKGNCQDTMTAFIAAVAKRTNGQAELDKAKNATVTKVTVTGDTATAIVSGAEQPVPLQKIDGEWKISGFAQ